MTDLSFIALFCLAALCIIAFVVSYLARETAEFCKLTAERLVKVEQEIDRLCQGDGS